ncbi:hypothetical protein GUJ93_ZPchr0003g18528 [Zizania palustris]|uniref:Glycosyl transferase family 28 C-terminal domain-containing protein n=1 Tax=Zizania palustris TaxID=103762 RepID=A0A8J5SV80_ZIZPA|nr:hypothetical protein GUJ93_ZPchr0003g18528 [Zizania palustris]
MGDRGRRMVFVTVGTTCFDALVKVIDSEAMKEALLQKGYTDLVIQMGRGTYMPSKVLGSSTLQVDYFTFSPSIADYIREASLVISHAARFQRSDAMMTFVPSTWSAEEMQALADLQQAIAILSASLGLAPMASKLSSFPHGAAGFPTASSPSPIAVAGAQGGGGNWFWWLGTDGGATGGKGDTSTGQTLAKLPLSRVASDSRRATEDTNRELPTMEKQPWVDSPCAITLATPDEEGHNRSLDFIDRSLYSTNGDGADSAPQPLPPSADDDGADPEEEGDYEGGGDEGQDGKDDSRDGEEVVDSAIRSFSNSTDDDGAKLAPQPLIHIATARHARRLEGPLHFRLFRCRASQPSNWPHFHRSSTPGLLAVLAQDAAKGAARASNLSSARHRRLGPVHACQVPSPVGTLDSTDSSPC